MPKVELIETPEPVAEESVMISQTAGSLLLSIAFWMVLLIAATLYAGVALSPKIADWINVRQQCLTNAGRLTQLEDEADYLERVAAALKNDPEFARRLVRANQNSGSGGPELVPVSQDLLFGGTAKKAPPEVQVVQPVVAKAVFHLASHQQHRTWLLIASASLTLLAFTLLNDAGVGIVRTGITAAASCLSAVIHRYRRPAPDVPSTDIQSRDEGLS